MGYICGYHKQVGRSLKFTYSLVKRSMPLPARTKPASPNAQHAGYKRANHDASQANPGVQSTWWGNIHRLMNDDWSRLMCEDHVRLL
jgi:hypothetical protein